MTGIELEEVHRTLVACFDQNSFAFFLKTKMDRVLTHLAGPGPFNTVVFEVLTVAEQEGWDALLIARAAEVRPHRGDIQDLAQKYGRTLVGQLPANARNSSARDAYRELGLAPQGFPTEIELGRLEKLINPQNKMLNMAVWVERAVRSQGPVCRVEIDGEPMGTGFLVGPSAVLTNHHVVDRFSMVTGCGARSCSASTTRNSATERSCPARWSKPADFSPGARPPTAS